MTLLNNKPVRSLSSQLFAFLLVIGLTIIFRLKPEWFREPDLTNKNAREKYIKTSIEPLQLKAIVINLHQIKFKRRFYNSLQLHNGSDLIELPMVGDSIGQMYMKAFVNDSIIKHSGSRLFILKHRTESFQYLYQ